MSHYEERLANDLDRIRQDLVAVGRKVERGLESALRALLANDRGVAYETILGDLEINRDIRTLDARCHAFVARHLPSAGHLRFVSSILRMTIEVERVGDYAATMCRAIAQLDRAVDGKVLDEIKSIGLSSIQMFREAIDAFQESDASKAKSLKSKSDLIERSLITAFDEIIDEGNSGKRQLEELFDLFIIVNRFDRVSDQSKNLCEEIIFWLTGETKPLKRYRIQFTDSVGDGRLNIALAVAHKMYPESASYAGKTGESIDAFTAEQLDRNGLNPANATRTDWDPDVADPAHVIVSLSGNVLNDIDKVPFHSIAQDWDLPGRISSDLPETEKADAFKALIQNISVRLQSLVEALRGEENAN